MISLSDFQKLIAPVKKRIFLLIGRAILEAVNNSEKTQKIQITGLSGETITDAERFQEYGFESYPAADSEAVIAFLNGNRDQGIVLCVHDRRYRPTDLSEGESRMYTKSSNKITLKANGSIEIEDKNGHIVKLDSTGITFNTGDATAWTPCIIPNCIFSGAPHGGAPAGIVKLKGA